MVQKNQKIRKYLKNGNLYKIGDTLRSKDGFTFIVEYFYKYSFDNIVYCSGRSIGRNKAYDYKDVGIIVGVKEEDCELVRT